MTAEVRLGTRRRAFGLNGGRLLGAGAGFLAQLLLARILGPQELGLFYLLTSAALVLGSLAALAYGGLASRLVAHYRKRQDPAGLEGFCGLAWRDGLGCALIAALAASAAAPLWGAPVSFGLLAAAAIPAFTLLRINGGIANAVGAQVVAFMPDTFLRPVLLLAVVALASLGGSLSLGAALAAFAGTALMLALGQWLATLRALESALRGFSRRHVLRASPKARRVAGWRRAGLGLLLPLLVGSLFGDLVILLAGAVLLPASVGIFGAAAKIALLVGFPVHLAHQTAAPAFAAALAHGDRERLATAIARANRAALVPAVVGIVLLLIGGVQLLAMFGEAFRDGYGALAALAAIPVARALAGPVLPLLAAAGKPKALLMPNLLLPVLLGVAMFAVAPTFGVTGVGIAAFLATSGFLLWTSRIAARVIGMRCDALALCRA